MAPPRGLFKGSRNPNWKGEAGGYTAAHMWIASVLGRPWVCQECGRTVPPRGQETNAAYFQWANISGHYLRIVEDWKRLCLRCHYEFDRDSRLNSKPRIDNKSGYRGVSWIARDRKWLARIYVGKKPIDIGKYATPEEAHAARLNYPTTK